MPLRTTIKIAEMLERTNISDSDLMIVEDDIDTKRMTIKELKRAFNGDGFDPDPYKFYSSQQVKDMVDSLSISISTLPTAEEFESLKQQVEKIQTGAGGGSEKDPELVAARGSYDTLSDRLEGDLNSLEDKYIQFPKVEHMGMIVDLSNIEKADVDITCPAYSEQTTLYISGKNKYTHGDSGYSQVTKTATGLKWVYTKTQNAFNIPIGVNLAAGEYILYGDFSFSDDFVKEGTVLKLVHTDGSTTTVGFDYSNKFRFSVSKAIKAFQILPNVSTIADNMWMQMDNIMISSDGSLESYYPYCDESYTIEANKIDTKHLTLQRCIISRSASTVSVSAIDTSYTGTKIKEEIEELQAYTTQPEDYCGLLEEKGTYVYAENHTKLDSPAMCTMSIDNSKMRNSKPSVKITYLDYNEDDQPRFTIAMEDVLNLSDARMISFQFYIDKDLSERFSEEDGIKIMLSSDSIITNPATNYYYFDIGKNSFVQGWNTIKLKIADFLPHGNPNLGNITQVNFRLYSSEFTNGKSIWINSIIIDQKMKPVVLFAFDNFYEEAFDYQFPYLYSRGIPATVFANDKQTLTRTYMDNVAKLHYQYGWDLGNYGCNPNKEIMIEDDNPREQYMAVKETRQWLYDNFTEKVLAYAAPFGNMRAISEPILKEMGFKIAKATADQYCSFFSKEDFVVPMHLLSNAEGCGADDINAKIDEIIETGQVLCIYTDNVTRYGDDISATKVSFESVIEHILKYVNQGSLECMTFTEFYEKCTSR